MSLSQNDSGRAFEYGIAVCLSELIPAKIQNNSQILKAKSCFDISSTTEREKIVIAANEICSFIIAHDDLLTENDCIVSVQPDQNGRSGDVRDIVIFNSKLNQQIGISAKNRHAAVKHSRLSSKIDFGSNWFNIKCSESYFNIVAPIFSELRELKAKGEKWNLILEKKEKFYDRVLQAFEDEIKLLFQINPTETAKALVQYLLGKFDYYKVIKENGNVSAMSFNINGTLKWGSKMPLPSRIISIQRKPESDTTLLMTFDRGWQLSFRIHNASSRVEPSLKFDINIVGMPRSISRHEISYHR